jgi:uncharacterized protein (DUF4415 family)
MTTKRKPIYPTDEEDAIITAAALSDPDAQPLTDEQLAKLKPARGRPLGSGKKVQLTVRFDSEIVETFKGMGNGWQTRMNDALKAWLEKR